MENNKQANMGPLGLLGFGLTTILLNLHNVGLLDSTIVIVAMGIAMGGTAQIIAGIISFKQGKTFAGTAFTSYGLFWLSLVMIWLMGPKYGMEADLPSMGFYLLLWGIYTAFMALGTKSHPTISKIVFWSLALLFVLLAIGDFADSEVITIIAGGVGIFTGLSAFYEAVGQIVNEEFGKTILPM